MDTGPDLETVGHYYEHLENEAYPDPGTGGDPWTCGIGCTGKDSEGNIIGPGTYWDDAKALREYGYRINEEFSPGVDERVHVELTQKEYDMLVDFAYNVGLHNFETSTLLKKLNAGDKRGAADEFPKWNKAAGKVMKGLQRRRYVNRAVFLGGDANEAIREANKFFP
jgi:lysozyme